MVDENNQHDDDFGAFHNDSIMEEDDFLAADRGAPDDLDAPPSKPNLKEIWDQNPSLKIFAAVAFAAVVLVSFMVFGSDNNSSEENASAISAGRAVTQPPGTEELPPAYEEAVRQASEQRAEEAALTGGSALPTPIARPSERIEAPVQVEENDPLSEWRREAEQRREEREGGETPATATQQMPPLPANNNFGGGGFNGQQAVQQPPPLPTSPTPEMVSSMAQQLQQQMQTIMETQIPKESVVVSMNIQPAYDMKKYYPPEEPASTTGNNANSGANGPSSLVNNTTNKPLIAAGTIAYGQILTQANSDVPGPVLAEVASGPLVGGRAIGQFSMAQRHLVIQFNRVVKDGIEYNVQAFALDPATTLPGVVSNIDRHYFSRILLPAAARFIEGFSSAATQTDNSVVVVDGSVVSNTNDLDTRQELLNGADEAAQELSSVLEQDFGNRPITITVDAGTRIGILFISSVFDPNMPQGQFNPNQQQQANGMGGGNGYIGQAYNAYNAYNNYANPQQQGNYNVNPAAAQYYQQQQMRQQQSQQGNYSQIGNTLRSNFR